MMKTKLLLLSVVAVFAMSAIAVLAQTTDHSPLDDDANACYEGGTLAGTCNSTDVDNDGDIEQNDIDWMWKCGYYLIRVENGIYSPDVLDGICMDVEEVIVEEVEEKKDKKKKKVEEEPIFDVCDGLCT